ncbi:MAG TPA: TldD/PmbA family protein [Bryobacteraceae bacterium]|nr:TldD/PmbA family protein [Bryobacteraceae bacterium]
MSQNHLLELANDVVKRALTAGATDAECTIAEGDEFTANVRMRELESLKEAGSRGAGLRILVGRRTGASYTSDLSLEGIDKLVRSAVELAEITTEDPHAGLPEPEELGSLPGNLELYSSDVEGLATGIKVDLAKRAEEAALSFDPRISNSEGASFDTHIGRHLFANSRGFSGEYRSSYCALGVAPVARSGESMERDHWDTLSRGFAGLESPESVGRMAAERALRRLNAVKVETQKVPVVFEPRTARTLLDHIFDAVHGMSVYRHESFLAGKLGEKVAAESVTVIDDATIPGRFGSSPFDDEGVPSRRTIVIEKGVLKNYLLNSYAARKLGMKTTGNASRGLTGNAGIGHGNFYVEKGVQSPDQILSGIANGFYVTELIGFGVNTVTGDYSRGAAGLWIRNGELAYAVSEVTIAGNLKEMLMGLEALGSDLEFRRSISAPTIKIGEMTVGGR